jgi:hypothetical protein
MKMVAHFNNIALRIISDKIFHFKAAIHSPPTKILLLEAKTC